MSVKFLFGVVICIGLVGLLSGRRFRHKQVSNKNSKYFELCNNFTYYSQHVDHFGFKVSDHYQQRFILSDKFWQPKGPIFFYTGNEGDIQWFCENTGFVWEIAQEFDALVVFAEHRFYGLSMPYGNKSYEASNINYLSSEQALADYAYLIKQIKSDRPELNQSPVIAFGGSYGGMLAAWFRMKYPNIVTGALAASAPIFQCNTDCGDFSAVITSAFKKADPLCPHIIRSSWDLINKMGESQDGLNNLSNIFHLCSPLTNSDDLKAYLNEIYGDVSMANYPYSANFLNPLPAWPIKEMCNQMTKSIDKYFSKNPLKLLNAIYKGVNVYNNFTGQLPCNNIDSDIPNIQMDSWDYQTCTEFVFPFCSDGVNDMFEPSSWDNITYSDSCVKKFGVRPKAEWPDFYYGGTLNDIKFHSNIIFSNGDLDPWSSGGVLESVNENLIAIVIENGAHHLDLRSANPNDPQSVKDARLLEIKTIKKWIADYRHKLDTKI